MLAHTPTLRGISFIYNPLILTVMLLSLSLSALRERARELSFARNSCEHACTQMGKFAPTERNSG